MLDNSGVVHTSSQLYLAILWNQCYNLRICCLDRTTIIYAFSDLFVHIVTIRKASGKRIIASVYLMYLLVFFSNFVNNFIFLTHCALLAKPLAKVNFCDVCER